MKVPFVNPVLNMMLGRKPSAPIMQLNDYSMDRMLGILQDAGCTEVHAILTDHQGNRGVMLLFQKPE